MPEIPAYPILFALWLIVAANGYWVAHLLGKKLDTPNDGCLLGVGNIALSLVGGGLGYLFAPYPWSLATSLVGSILLPGALTLTFLRKSR
jgi:hypothetical protein